MTDPLPQRNRPSRADALAVTVVLVATLLAYAPMVHQVVRLSARTTQAVNALVLIGFAVLDAWRTRRSPWRLAPRVNPHGVMLFALSCVAVAAASVTDLWPLAVLAFCLNLAALLSFLLGADGARALYPALVGIGAAVGMLTLLPRADGLLRWLAARFSARALSLIGFPTAIGVRRTPFAVALVVGRSGQAFDVAPECNGFGILLSAVVLAAIYAARRRDAWWRRILLLAVAVVIGLAVNALRIVVIVVLSLRTRLDYALIHEGAGTALYWLALLIIYALAARPWRRQEAS